MPRPLAEGLARSAGRIGSDREPLVQRLRAAVARSLRYKLLLLVLFPVLVVIPAILAIALYWAHDYTYGQLLRRIHTDLAVARDVFSRIQQDYGTRLAALADSYAFRTSFVQGDAKPVRNQLETLRVTGGLDWLHLTDLKGRWLFEPRASEGLGSKPTPLWSRAANGGLAGSGLEVFAAQDLEREGPELAQRSAVPLLSTRSSAEGAGSRETRGLVLRMVHPVRDERGQVQAMLDGGVLLNRNFRLVDAIRDLVYGPGSLPEDGWGAVTVVLDDVRVSTNVPLTVDRGERALGTREPREVRERVLGAGESWVGRAFVVNDWYISGYQPLLDVSGRVVGMLGLGFADRPYRDAARRALAALGAMLVLAMILAAVLAFRGARSVFQPVEAITAVVRATQAGEERRIGSVASQDEIGELARQFDRMLDLLRERNTQLKRAAEELEGKVEERTRELRAKNTRLEETIHLLHETRRQLVTAEKLAALGELTAGVAHEVLNPCAVILGNVEIVISELGPGVEPVRAEVDLIIEQVYRIRAIVDKLLQYSRPSRPSGGAEAIDPNRVIEDTLPLVRHEVERRQAVVECRLSPVPPVRIERQELQQVLVNLLVNALHAVDPGGRVELSTRPWSRIGASIVVKDEGSGIAPEHLSRVFDPFFTHSKEGGTGLGLSVSYGLVSRYGGQILVRSEPGRGTEFEVLLRSEPVFVQDEPLRVSAGEGSV